MKTLFFHEIADLLLKVPPKFSLFCCISAHSHCLNNSNACKYILSLTYLLILILYTSYLHPESPQNPTQSPPILPSLSPSISSVVPAHPFPMDPPTRPLSLSSHYPSMSHGPLSSSVVPTPPFPMNPLLSLSSHYPPISHDPPFLHQPPLLIHWTWIKRLHRPARAVPSEMGF